MATYDKYTYDIPAYHQGNVADFEFDLDSNFPINNISDISFQVRRGPNTTKDLVMDEKLLSTGGITLNNRTVTIPFTADEMKTSYGVFFYEIDFIDVYGDPFATIGGKFPINQETNSK